MILPAISDFGPQQFVHVLSNSGYEHPIGDFKKTRYHFLGRNKDGDFVFALSFQDEENIDDEMYYITLLLVNLDDKGLMKGEWCAQPIENELTLGEVNRYFDGLEKQAEYIK